ncbi:hypothetical protein CC80DRAFT_505123 [Byssothecium circinans]|uniref:Uncharacterized protein n=1 Tax=Byssothecium circinans TaxID=147558 RepID=A0A6A5TVN9_9PLEO|nr:hypothetical protein CC80DRAFT_505123 [Byssothecium circinans]
MYARLTLAIGGWILSRWLIFYSARRHSVLPNVAIIVAHTLKHITTSAVLFWINNFFVDRVFDTTNATWPWLLLYNLACLPLPFLFRYIWTDCFSGNRQAPTVNAANAAVHAGPANIIPQHQWFVHHREIALQRRIKQVQQQEFIKYFTLMNDIEMRADMAKSMATANKHPANRIPRWAMEQEKSKIWLDESDDEMDTSAD